MTWCSVSDATYFHLTNTHWLHHIVHPFCRDLIRCIVFYSLTTVIVSEYGAPALMVYTPHLMTVLLIASLMVHLDDHCVQPFIYGLVVGPIMVIFQSLCFPIDKLMNRYRPRTFGLSPYRLNELSLVDYISGVIEYVLSPWSWTEIKHRIIAVNYVLIFVDLLQSDVQKVHSVLFNRISAIHNDHKYIPMRIIRWNEMRDPESSMIPIYSLWTAVSLGVYNLLMIGGITTYRVMLNESNWNIGDWSFWTQMYAAYILYELLCVLLDIRYAVVYWLLYHLLPFITLESLDQIQMDHLDPHKVNECVFKLIWDRTDKMIDDISTFKEILFGARTVEEVQSALNLSERKPAEIITECLWTELPDHEWIGDVVKLKAFIMERGNEKFPTMTTTVSRSVITLRDEESKSPEVPPILNDCSSRSQVNVVMPPPPVPRRTTGDPLID